MKLNTSGTSMATSVKSSTQSHHQRGHILSTVSNEQILFELGDIAPDSKNTTPLDKCLKDCNRDTRQFFPSSKDLNRLPSINTKYRLTTQFSKENLPSLRKQQGPPVLQPSQRNRSMDISKLATETVIQPKSDEFYKFAKHSQRIEQYASLNNISPNVYIKLHKVMEKEKCMPRKLQMLDSHNDKELRATGSLSSSSYIKMFAAGLGSSSYNNLQKLNLSSNNMNNQDFQIIAESIPTSVSELELKDNRLNKHGMMALCTLLNRPRQCLFSLNIENNNIGDSGLMTLLSTLKDNKSLKVLNLSRNQIHDQPMKELGQILRRNQTITELYLHYNKITHRGGLELFRGLVKNSVLKVLDMSFNILGGDKQCTTAICNVISRPHPELLHLDLSHNSFNEEDSLNISNNLAFNKVIYGFHFEGNSKYRITNRGFLIKDTVNTTVVTPQQQIMDVEDDDRLQLELQLQNVEHDQSNQSKKVTRIMSVEPQLNVHEICWICQGWVELVFHWKVGKSGTIDIEPIFIHLEFEDYRPSLMEEAPGGFILYRMCPPNQTIRYFYSNPVLKAQVYAKDQKTIQSQMHSQLRSFGVPLEYANGTVIMSEPMHTVNFVQTGEPVAVFDKRRHYLSAVICKPREPERIVEIDPELAKRRVWSLDNSIFRDYDADTEAHLEQCLDFDLDAGKITRHIVNKSDIQQLKDVLKKYYKYIVQCYKHQASLSMEYDFPRISMTTIQAFFQQSRGLQQMKQVDWEISLISTIVLRDNTHQYLQERCLARHQMLELLVRLAKESQIRNGNMKYLHEAFEKVISPTGLLGFIMDSGCAQSWRDERYWTQIMDLTIRNKMPVLKALFTQCSSFSFKKLISKERYVSLTDWKQLFINLELIPDLISEQEVYFIFLQSMMMQVDELNQSRHFEMQFIEFIEALARVAEKISPNSPNYKDKYLNSKQRRVLPLYIKFEGLMYILYYKSKKLPIESTVVDRSVLFSHEAKKLGIFMEEDDQIDEEEDELEVNVDPQLTIMRLLHDDEARNSFRDTMSVISVNQSSGSKSRKNSLIIKQDSLKTQQVTNGWHKVRQMAKRNTLVASNIMQQLQLAHIENEMDEKLEYEESTPMNRLQIQNRQANRSKYAIDFNGPKYKFDLQE